MRGAEIEAAIGAARQPRDLAKRLFGNRIGPLLKHEGGHAKKSQLAGRVAQVIELFFHRIADEHEGLHRLDLRFPFGVSDHLANLRVTAAAVDLLHQPGEALGLRHPT